MAKRKHALLKGIEYVKEKYKRNAIDIGADNYVRAIEEYGADDWAQAVSIQAGIVAEEYAEWERTNASTTTRVLENIANMKKYGQAVRAYKEYLKRQQAREIADQVLASLPAEVKAVLAGRATAPRRSETVGVRGA